MASADGTSPSQVRTVCKRVRYSGRVQGVGFRYTAKQVADRFPIGGYVRNLPDGDVELIAQGQTAEVDAFLDAVARRMANYIGEVTVQEEPCGEGYRDFGIRH
jgi:acylphosphatase